MELVQSVVDSSISCFYTRYHMAGRNQVMKRLFILLLLIVLLPFEGIIMRHLVRTYEDIHGI